MEWRNRVCVTLIHTFNFILFAFYCCGGRRESRRRGIFGRPQRGTSVSRSNETRGRGRRPSDHDVRRRVVEVQRDAEEMGDAV